MATLMLLLPMAGRSSPWIMICITGGSWCSTIDVVHQNLMFKSLMAPNASGNMAMP
jgi:hypothetical protein